MKNGKKVWFITGANKGLGAAIAREALEQGYKVVAAARDPHSAGKVLGNSPNLLWVSLDLTDAEQIREAVRSALDKFGRVDVLVNNAGYGLMGHFEEVSEDSIRKQFETNVFGTMNLTREVLPAMRAQGTGWIVNVSSTSGIKAVEGGSAYSASKFAVEGWTEGLAIDLAPFGIRCMILEPGGMRTDFFNPKASFAFSDLVVDAYAPQREALWNHMMEMGAGVAGNPAKVAKALMSAMSAEHPPLRLLCGKYAVEAVDAYMKKRRDEFEAWKDVSAATDFD